MHVSFLSDIEADENRRDICMGIGTVLAIAVAVLVFLVLFSGCGVLFGDPAWTEPAVYAADGAVVSGTVQHPATAGILPAVGAGLTATGTSWGLVAGTALGALVALVQSWRLRSRVPAAVVVQAADKAQSQILALKPESPGSAARVDIGDLLGTALRDIGNSETLKKVQAAFEKSRAV